MRANQLPDSTLIYRPRCVRLVRLDCLSATAYHPAAHHAGRTSAVSPPAWQPSRSHRGRRRQMRQRPGAAAHWRLPATRRDKDCYPCCVATHPLVALGAAPPVPLAGRLKRPGFGCCKPNSERVPSDPSYVGLVLVATSKAGSRFM